MRSFEVLVRSYPDKTGKELLAIQEEDKVKDEKEFQKRHKEKLKFIDDINNNGGYYKGKFGFCQHYFYRVFDLKIEDNGKTIGKVESLVVFVGDDRGVIKNGELRFERNLKEYADIEKYSLNTEERVTKKEWDKANEYLDRMVEKFW